MKIQAKNDFTIPYLSNDTLVKEANNFLALYNRNNTTPVPIEHIAEYGLNITITPTKGLMQLWGIDAFINSELNTIYIDYNTYLNQEDRTRFTIAHEIAHKVLHKDFYEKLEIDNEKSYLNFQDNGNIKMKKRMEYQAYFFAGYLVLPQNVFNLRFEALLKTLAVIDVDDLSQIMHILSEEFGVSGECLQKQIEREYPDLIKSIIDSRSN